MKKKSKKINRKGKANVPPLATSVSPDTVLALRVCPKNLITRNGFRWPESGPVECPDWDLQPECGHGLHGWLWGIGDHSAATWDADMRWLVVEVDRSSIVDLGGKVKFHRGVVVHCGDQATATQYVRERLPKELAGASVIGSTASAGDRGTASAGDRGTASAGDRGTASAGYLGTASAGDRGTASAGDRGTASAGDRGTASAGYLGTASAGYLGTASAGDRGTASAGYRGTASAGYLGTASAGDRGTASAGDEGIVIGRHWDGTRWRICVGYVGEDGIENGKPYHVEGGKLVAGEHPEAKSAREYAAKISAMKAVDRP
jgi:hypothetical protein